MKRYHKRAKGMALVAALILLLGLTVLGLSSMKLAHLQERMARNTTLTSQAFHTSDSSLIFGELSLKVQNTRPEVDAETTCLSPPCELWGSQADLNFQTATNVWWLAQGKIPTYSTDLPTALSESQNRFVIEEIQFITDDLDPDSLSLSQGTVYYRVTSWGIANDGAQSMLQSIYAQRY